MNLENYNQPEELLVRPVIAAFAEAMEERMVENDGDGGFDDSWLEDQLLDVLEDARHNWKQVREHTLDFIQLVTMEASHDRLYEKAGSLLEASADTANYLAMLNWLVNLIIGPRQIVSDELLDPVRQPRAQSKDFAKPDADHSIVHFVQIVDDIPDHILNDIPRIVDALLKKAGAVTTESSPKPEEKPFRGRLLFNQDRQRRRGPNGASMCPYCENSELSLVVPRQDRNEGHGWTSSVWHCLNCKERFDVRHNGAILRNVRLREESKNPDINKPWKSEEKAIPNRNEGREALARVSLLEEKLNLDHPALFTENPPSLAQEILTLRKGLEKATKPQHLGIRYDQHPNGKYRIYREPLGKENREWLTFITDSRTKRAFYSFRDDEIGAAAFTDEEAMRNAIELWHAEGRN